MKLVLRAAAAACLALFGVGAAGISWADGVVISTPADARGVGLESLRRARNDIPLPDLSEVVNPGSQAEQALIQLGKIAFWDTQIGSSGQSGATGMACASCHFHAGADTRSTNMVNPGLNKVVDDPMGDIVGLHNAGPSPDESFQTRHPNETLTASDFPTIRVQDEPANPLNSNDSISSQGVISSQHLVSSPGVADDYCRVVFDSVFQSIHGQTRRVEPRNTPSVINAWLNSFLLFWDGRANALFNGANPHGVADPDANIWAVDGTEVVEHQILLPLSGLASQASGPALSDFEASCAGRMWADIGVKIFGNNRSTGQPLTPLGRQLVHASDSVLGALSNSPSNGVSTTYTDLVQTAFQSRFWDDSNFVIVHTSNGFVIHNLADGRPPRGTRYRLIEANASLFIPLAIQRYEQTLISDRSGFDNWMYNGRMSRQFGEAELRGLNVFVNEGKCINCHSGPEFTSASVRNNQVNIANGKPRNLIEAMTMGDHQNALYDNGFYNIGVRPTWMDVGRGGKGPGGEPLASSRQRLFEEQGIQSIPFEILGGDRVPAFGEEGGMVCNDTNFNGNCEENEPILPEFQRAAVDGSFKTPGLHNVELTGPYFHNGGHATLRQVVEFYNNGGDFCNTNIDNLDPDIAGLGLTDQQKDDLVAFMVSLTDLRVAYQTAPFDHPSIMIANSGIEGGSVIELPAVGRRGLRSEGYPAIDTFLGLDPNYVGNARVNDVCSPNIVPPAAQ